MDRTLLEALRTAGLLDITDEQLETLATLDVEALADDELGDLGDVVRSAVETVVDQVESGESEDSDEAIAAAAGLRDGFVALAAAAHARMGATQERQQRLDAIVAAVSGTEGAERPSGGPQSHRPRIEAVAARRRASERGRTRSTSAGRMRISSAAGVELHNVDDIAHTIYDVARDLRSSKVGEGNVLRHRVATIEAVDVPEDRYLRGNDHARNAEKIEAVRTGGRQALAASGGLCAPLMPIYQQLGISDARRPVRDSLPNFQADRGGVIHMPPPRFHRALSTAELAEDSGAHDFSNAVGQWTVANDVALNNPATKPILRVDCEEEVTEETYFVTKRLEIGNFYNMTFQERVRAIVDLLSAEHAALAEELLLNKIVSLSTADSTGQELGAARDILVAVERAATAYRARHRMPRDAVLDGMFPEWIINAIRADLSRQVPGDDELGTADNEIVSMLNRRGVNPTFYADRMPVEFGAQAVGALNAWPAVCEWGLWSAGSWLFLDNGTIDLGIIRDSVLSAQNDLQMFAETGEGAAFVGVESLWIQSAICVTGQTSAPANADTLCLGS